MSSEEDENTSYVMSSVEEENTSYVLSSVEEENTSYVNEGAENFECEYATIYEPKSSVDVNDEPRTTITKGSSTIGEKPGHKKSDRRDEGLYDELSYDLDQPAQVAMNQKGNTNGVNGSLETAKTDSVPTQNLIITVIGILLIGMIAAGIVLSIQSG